MKKSKKPRMKLSEKLVNAIVKYFGGILIVSVVIYALKGQLPTLRYYIMFIILGLIAIILLILIIEFVLWVIRKIKEKREVKKLDMNEKV